MSQDPLLILRAAIGAKVEPQLLLGDDESSEKTDDIVAAKSLLIPAIPTVSTVNTVLSLDGLTRFESRAPEVKMLDLRSIYNCYLTRELPVTSYISESEKRGIFNLKFLERTDLITWLEGASNESEHIKSLDASDSKGTKAKQEKRIDLNIKRIYGQERALVDHNSILRGNKALDFRSVSKECQQQIIAVFRNSSRQGSTRNKPSVAKHQEPSKPSKEPIIILSPSASALLRMSNIKSFLKDGQYTDTGTSASSTNMLKFTRSSPRFGDIRFVVTDSVDRFKPEYWDRVVAVFVTGQAWQLKPYKWSDPNQLFQKVLGFGMVFKGDPVPAALKNWNIELVTVDPNHRFRDKEVVERIWDRLEKFMVLKGWPTKERRG